MKHLLVTNDFPPKAGGIQTYLWELWRRLPADSFVVLTTPHAGAVEFDAQQPFRVVRTREKVLLPLPALGRQIDALADEVGADLVILDPVAPVGLIGQYLRHRFGVIVHGAEVTVPGHLPASKQLIGSVLRAAEVVIAAGGYPAAEAEHAAKQRLPIVTIPPGVDTGRFVPLAPRQRAAARQRFRFPSDAFVVYGQSRLVPRKGFDTLIRAVAELRRLFPVEAAEVHLAIGGRGRDRSRLERVAADQGLPVNFLGFVSDSDLPLAYGSADVFAMLCRNRWGGLEQEGFGIVFLEAAAAGVPQIAGHSGGAHEAVVDGSTGLVVADSSSVSQAVAALHTMLTDPVRRHSMADAGRERAVAEFSYDVLAARLAQALAD